MPRRSLALASFLATLAILASGRAANSETEVRLLRTLPVEGTPVDVAIAPDGSQVVVLTEGGRLSIYAPDGSVRDRVELGEGVDRIVFTPRGDGLLASSAKDKSVRLLLLETTQKIEAEGAPSKGPADAPVVVAVFSDFQ